MLKRVFCLLACLFVIAPTHLAAQSYPTKPIRLIVPFTPGGSTDATARIVGEAMAAILGQPLVIENRPGAAATLGIDLVAKSKPDGYTLGVSGVGATAIIPIIDPKLPYHPSRDLDVIAGLNSVYGVIVAKPDFKQNNMVELFEFARANPEKMTYSTSGVAGPAHLNLEYLQQLSGMKTASCPLFGRRTGHYCGADRRCQHRQCRDSIRHAVSDRRQTEGACGEWARYFEDEAEARSSFGPRTDRLQTVQSAYVECSCIGQRHPA